MYAPGELLRAYSTITPAVAGTKINVAIIAGPGAGLRLRIWSVTVAVANTGTFPNRWWADVQSAALSRRWIQSAAGFNQATVEPPGGIPFGDNEGLTIGITSDVAAVNFSAVVFYTVERV